MNEREVERKEIVRGRERESRRTSFEFKYRRWPVESICDEFTMELRMCKLTRMVIRGKGIVDRERGREGK